jgi:hypothetical protein
MENDVVFQQLKTFANISAVADGWKMTGGTGGIEEDGETATGVLRETLVFMATKASLSATIKTYYGAMPSWDAADIKARQEAGALYTFPAGTWTNAGFSWSDAGKGALCTLVLELRV